MTNFFETPFFVGPVNKEVYDASLTKIFKWFPSENNWYLFNSRIANDRYLAEFERSGGSQIVRILIDDGSFRIRIIDDEGGFDNSVKFTDEDKFIFFLYAVLM